MCSQKGEIMLVNSDGGFITFLNDSTTNNWHIESIVPFSKGFIVGGDGLTVQIYEATNDETTYYVKGTTMNVIISSSYLCLNSNNSLKKSSILKKPGLPHYLSWIISKTKFSALLKTITFTLSVLAPLLN